MEHRDEPQLGLRVLQQFCRQWQRLGGVRVGHRPQREKRRLGLFPVESLLTRGRIVEELLDTFDGLRNDLRADRVPLKSEPDIDRPHHRTEPDQIFFSQQFEHSAKRCGMRLVDRFENDLPQSLLPLRRDQRPLHQRPALHARGGQQTPHHMPPHRPDRVFVASRRAQDLEHLVTDRSPGINHSRQKQRRFTFVPVVKVIEMRQPLREPDGSHHFWSQMLGETEQADDRFHAVSCRRVGRVWSTERLSPVAGSKRHGLQKVPQQLDRIGQIRQEGGKKLATVFRGQLRQFVACRHAPLGPPLVEVVVIGMVPARSWQLGTIILAKEQPVAEHSLRLGQPRDRLQKPIVLRLDRPLFQLLLGIFRFEHRPSFPKENESSLPPRWPSPTRQ